MLLLSMPMIVGQRPRPKKKCLRHPVMPERRKRISLFGSIDSLRLLFNATDKRRNFASENNMAGGFGLFSKSAVSKKNTAFWILLADGNVHVVAFFCFDGFDQASVCTMRCTKGVALFFVLPSQACRTCVRNPRLMSFGRILPSGSLRYPGFSFAWEWQISCHARRTLFSQLAGHDWFTSSCTGRSPIDREKREGNWFWLASACCWRMSLRHRARSSLKSQSWRNRVTRNLGCSRFYSTIWHSTRTIVVMILCKVSW